MARYKLNPAAFREEVLNASWMEAHMLSVAERAETVAEASAPFYENDPDGIHYRDGFHVSSGKNGGIHHDRAYGRLENTDMPTALYVEWGTKNNPAHHTIRNAMTEAAGQ